MGSDGNIAGLAIFGIFIMPVIALIVMRVLAHRERVEMIRHGMVPPSRFWRDHKGWSQMGAEMPPPMPPGQWSGYANPADNPDRSLRKGIMLALIGLAIFIGLSFIGFQQDGPFTTFRPGPWLLGGLIPMFVGIAQIIIALLSGARLGIPNAAPYPPPSYPSPPPGRPGPDMRVDGPEPRTQSGYEELKRPVPPPERR